jgi:uncharacterized protein YbjT (DUF2867 family)
MLLVTGAGGKSGQAIIGALLARGEIVRAFARNRQQAQSLGEMGVQEVVVGDLLNDDALRRAVAGVRAIYHICPNMHPQEVVIGQMIIAQAQAAQVERFVYHSVLHPQSEGMPHHWNKMRVEELLFQSRLPFTILQPAAYMQNILASWHSILAEGVYAVPYPAETKLSLIDLVDLSAAAATVLSTDGHVDACYELAGTPALSQNEVAQILSAVLKRPVRVAPVSLEQWQANARQTRLNDYAIDTLCKMFRYYQDFGLSGNPNVLTWLLGRAPHSLADFVRRQAYSPVDLSG